MGSPSPINIVLGILMPANSIFLSRKQHGGSTKPTCWGHISLALALSSPPLLRRLLETLGQLSIHHTAPLPQS